MSVDRGPPSNTSSPSETPSKPPHTSKTPVSLQTSTCSHPSPCIPSTGGSLTCVGLPHYPDQACPWIPQQHLKSDSIKPKPTFLQHFFFWKRFPHKRIQQLKGRGLKRIRLFKSLTVSWWGCVGSEMCCRIAYPSISISVRHWAKYDSTSGPP